MPHLPSKEGKQEKDDKNDQIDDGNDDKQGADLLLSLGGNKSATEMNGSAAQRDPLTPSPPSMNENEEGETDKTEEPKSKSPVKISPPSTVTKVLDGCSKKAGTDENDESPPSDSGNKRQLESKEEVGSNKQARSDKTEKAGAKVMVPADDDEDDDDKPVISPSSSDEGVSAGQRTAPGIYDKMPPRTYYYDQQAYQQHAHHGPHHPSYGPPTHYGHSYPVYPHAPYHHYSGQHHYYRGGMPPQHQHMMYPHHPSPYMQPIAPPFRRSSPRPEEAVPATATSRKEPKAMRKLPRRASYEGESSSDARGSPDGDWRSTSPSVPSSNRCIPRKNLYPPSDWEAQQGRAQFTKVPDFHHLVNFPDFLTRGRAGSAAATKAEVNGMKHCVMCGKLRLCSSSNSTVGRARGDAPKQQQQHEEDTVHIIPRQNKGVCTGCDVTVWIVLDQPGLEIKWCKGCKNFRPWPCFGEKVLATKCVRCRHRQKEKYAAQKNQSRADVRGEKDEQDVAAADGLRTLMNHASC